MITGHWIFNNIIALSFAVTMISIIRLPSIKVGCIALVCLLVYDIFWVFFSERFFGANVMVTVATTAAHNPLSTVASKLGFDAVVSTIQLPMKVIWGYHMLGLGDIVLPGLLVALAMKVDYYKVTSVHEHRNSDDCVHVHWSNTYFVPVALGYAFGLLCSLVAVLFFRVAQPALLYLVPSTLFPIVFMSYWRNEFGQLWHGIPFKKSDGTESKEYGFV